MISGPLTWMKWALVSWATARAMSVLPQPGRAVQEHALGRVDAQPLEDLRVAQRQLDDLADAADFALQAADVLVGDGAAFLRRALAGQADGGFGANQHRPVGDGLGHGEGLGARPNKATRTWLPETTGMPSRRRAR